MKYEIYSGAGNDFVMINNWDNKIPFAEQEAFTIAICNDKFKEIDGVIFLDKPQKIDSALRMNYYNRDGSFGAMCGNGARCISMFAFKNNITGSDSFIMEAVDDLYAAEICDDLNVKILFPEPREVRTDIVINAEFGNGLKEMNVNYVDVGSDHIVIFIDDEKNNKALNMENIDELDINHYGEIIRFHNDFQPKGGNVNFVNTTGGDKLRLRTYERGVERETLACGTGIVASGIISVMKNKCKTPVSVHVQSGEVLIVDFTMQEGKIANLSLKGSARKIDEGEL